MLFQEIWICLNDHWYWRCCNSKKSGLSEGSSGDVNSCSVPYQRWRTSKVGHPIRHDPPYQPWCAPKVVHSMSNGVHQKWLTSRAVVYTISDITLLEYLNLSTLKLMLSYHWYSQAIVLKQFSKLKPSRIHFVLNLVDPASPFFEVLKFTEVTSW